MILSPSGCLVLNLAIYVSSVLSILFVSFVVVVMMVTSMSVRE